MYTIVLRNGCPYTNVKLSTIKQEGVLDVLLYDPRLCLRIFLENKVVDVSKISEKLDAFALIHRGWLDKPHVLRTMLHWHALFVGAPARDFFVASH